MTRTSPSSPPRTWPTEPLALRCHPATPCPTPLQVSVTLETAQEPAGNVLVLRYQLRGHIGALRIPEAAPPGFADNLWRHTCFEAFVASLDHLAYQEFNFSPSGQWASYCFSRERLRDPAAEADALALQPATELTRSSELLTLQVSLPWHALTATTSGRPWLLGLTAVIETQDGQLCYWALHHPGATPDFHHRDGFTLHLTLPSPDHSNAREHPHEIRH